MIFTPVSAYLAVLKKNEDAIMCKFGCMVNTFSCIEKQIYSIPISPGGPTLPGLPGAPFCPFSPGSPFAEEKIRRRKYEDRFYVLVLYVSKVCRLACL